ncbi:aspartyl protease family protein [Salegentibacter flavus]|uniref:PDZ domain-containing protein n=1 Tax=Salegentibacter flavus TaxID=287099 RepID=A0A1I4XV01_9FLAO|nr:aspartyl protease family protein [Salegentibacter flavus]SFN29721.1 PDZ domain-containing protein [Salegentibacter flavus]
MKRLMFFWLLMLWLTGLTIPLTAQSEYRVENQKGYFKLPFQLINDLVIVPVTVNGVELSFLLDTGVNATLIFAIDGEIPDVKNTSRIFLRGLGAGEPVMALKAINNKVTLGDAVSEAETLYIVEEELIGLSNRLGIELNGILGYDFFRDFIVNFNYRRKFIKVYAPEIYNYKKCRRCVDIPLIFDENKPYLEAKVEMEDQEHNMLFLLDSGSGDAVWIFTDEERGITVPHPSFEDFLGYSISGSVYGKRSRISSLSLGDLKLKEVTASFPDSLYVKDVSLYDNRNGSIGSQIMKRFHYTLDYPGKNLRLKPNLDFRKSFEYDMSGVVVQHTGQRIVRHYEAPPPFFDVEEIQSDGEEVSEITYQLKFSLAPQYQIAEIRPGSPVEKAGLQIGDIILEINGKPAHKYSLDKISSLFTSRDGRLIKLIVERELKEMKFTFMLKRIL